MSSPIDPHTVFVIIPAYNEQEVIVSVIQSIQSLHYSIVVVDDGSVKNMYAVLENLPVYFLRHSINLGQGAALQTGIEFAISKHANFIVTFDADGQHNADDIKKMLDKLIETKSDMVLGSRFKKGSVNNMPFKRSLLLQFGRYINFIFTGLLLTDAHNGLRVMTRQAALQLHLKENRMAHATEILSIIKKQRLHYIEIPVSINYSNYSRNKGQNLWSSFRIFFELILNKIFK